MGAGGTTGSRAGQGEAGERGHKSPAGIWGRRGTGREEGPRRQRLRPPAAPLTFPVVQGCGAQRGGGAGGGGDTPQQPGRGSSDRQQHREGGGGRRGRGRRHCCPARPPLPGAAGRPGGYHGNGRRCAVVTMVTGVFLAFSLSPPPHLNFYLIIVIFSLFRRENIAARGVRSR